MTAPPEVFVVMPAFDERELIAKAMSRVPPSVKRLIVVDDGSRDGTPEVAESERDFRTVVLRRKRNGGVGRAIADGYRAFLKEAESGRSVCVVMAGDAQMDPSDLPALLAPFVDRSVGYVKGNRLADRRTRASMPLHRNFGTRALTILTRIASGYGGIHDSQCGYTAISAEALRSISLDRLYPRYGYPNDLLIKLGAAGVKIAEAPVRAVYGSERSKLRPARVAPRILLLLFRGFLWRLSVRRHGWAGPLSAGIRAAGAVTAAGSAAVAWWNGGGPTQSPGSPSPWIWIALAAAAAFTLAGAVDAIQQRRRHGLPPPSCESSP